MKKIKLCVAGLLLSGMSYGQSACCIKTAQDVYEYEGLTMDSYQENVKQFKAIEYRLMDLIDAVKMDMYYGRISQDNGKYYINEIAQLQYENKLLMAKIYKNEADY